MRSLTVIFFLCIIFVLSLTAVIFEAFFFDGRNKHVATYHKPRLQRISSEKLEELRENEKRIRAQKATENS
tara:strand:+ start:856 stop:1068 length:213 start_codon:yes stop_codon:yes gene_type:complete